MADYNMILDNVEKHIALSTEEKDYFLTLLKTSCIQKKGLILEHGRRCRTINFVTSGTFRAYLSDKDGKESTVMFAIKDWWITDMHSFINRQPALLNIEALENSQVLSLEYSSLQKLYEQVPKFERFFRILMQNAYVREQLRALDNISKTSEERYYKFVSKYPQITEKVTQKQIASYLGITPEFLSMIKRKNKALKLS